MSTLRYNKESKRVPCRSQRSSGGRLCSLLLTLRTILSAAVVCAVIQSSGCVPNEAASGNYGRGSGKDIQVAGEQVRDLSGDGAEGKELAFGSQSRNRGESRSVVRGVQPGYRLPEGRCNDSKCLYPVFDKAQFCLAQNVFWEARDQDIAGQVAVAQVTMNRVASPMYPNDVCSVVHQHKQFSWYWDGKSDVPREAAAWNRAQMVARGVLSGSGHANLMNVNITHYHAAYVQPYWTKSMQLVATIDDHLIYNASL